MKGVALAAGAVAAVAVIAALIVTRTNVSTALVFALVALGIGYVVVDALRGTTR